MSLVPCRVVRCQLSSQSCDLCQPPTRPATPSSILSLYCLSFCEPRSLIERTRVLLYACVTVLLIITVSPPFEGGASLACVALLLSSSLLSLAYSVVGVVVSPSPWLFDNIKRKCCTKPVACLPLDIYFSRHRPLSPFSIRTFDELDHVRVSLTDGRAPVVHLLWRFRFEYPRLSCSRGFFLTGAAWSATALSLSVRSPSNINEEACREGRHAVVDLKEREQKRGFRRIWCF